MPPIPPQPDPRIEPELLLVTGAHLRAEVFDRAIAYRLRDAILADLNDDADNVTLAQKILVCSDLWYLNHEQLRNRPTISVGGPEVSALAAYLADRLPSLYAVDGVCVIQAEPSFDPPVIALWGAGPQGTARAVEAFQSRYLHDFLDAVFR